MKKVRLSVNLAIIGLEGSGKKLFPQYLDEIALNSRLKRNIREYLVLHDGIPFKIRLAVAESFDQLIDEELILKSLDGLIICVDIYETHSIDRYTPKNFEKFVNHFKFQGLTVLTGVDSYFIEKGVPSEYFRISRLNLRKKTDQLNFIYCFEIQNKNRDMQEIVDKLLDDIILRFQNANPELLEYAKKYGVELFQNYPPNQNY